ncbi:UNVERIFIED_ORG: hypothetical protein HNP28_002661 [Comamonas terrigena]
MLKLIPGLWGTAMGGIGKLGVKPNWPAEKPEEPLGLLTMTIPSKT